MAGNKGKSKIQPGKFGKVQFGGGKSRSWPNLAGNFMFKSKKASKSKTNKKGKKAHGRKGGRGGRHHTQIPSNDGFISKRLRNRPTKRPPPPDGIVNKLPSVHQTPSKLRPQQLSWGN